MPTVASFDVRIGAKVDDFTRKIRRLQEDIRGLRQQTNRDFIRPMREGIRGIDREVDSLYRTIRKFRTDLERTFSRETFKIKIKAELDDSSINQIRRQIAHAVGVPITGRAPIGGGGAGGFGAAARSGGMSTRTKLLLGALGLGAVGAYQLGQAVIPPAVLYGGPAAAALYSAPVLHQVYKNAWRERLNPAAYYGLNRQLARGTIFTTRDTAAMMRALMDAGIESPSALLRHGRQVIRYAEAHDMDLAEAAEAYAALVERRGAGAAYRAWGGWASRRGAQDTLYGDYRRFLSQGTRFLDALVMENEPWMRAFMRGLNERMDRLNTFMDIRAMGPQRARALGGEAFRQWQTLSGESWFMTTLRAMLGTKEDPLAEKNALIQFLTGTSEDRARIIGKGLEEALEQIDYGSLVNDMAKEIGESPMWRNLGKYLPWEDIGRGMAEGLPKMFAGMVEGFGQGFENLMAGVLERYGIDPNSGLGKFLTGGAGLAGAGLAAWWLMGKFPGGDFLKDLLRKGGKEIAIKVKTVGGEALKSLLGRLKGIPKRVTSSVSVKAGNALKQIGSLGKRLRGLNKTWKAGSITTNPSPANKRISDVIKRLRGLNKTWRAGKIDTNPGPANSKISSLIKRLRGLNRRWRAGSIDVDTGPAHRKISSLIGRLRSLRRRKWHGGGVVGPDLDVDDYIDWGDIFKKAGRLGRRLNWLGWLLDTGGGSTPEWKEQQIREYYKRQQEQRHGGGAIRKAHSGMAFDAMVVQGAGTVPVNLWGGEMILTQQQQKWLFDLIQFRRDPERDTATMLYNAVRELVRALKSNKGNTVINYNLSPTYTGPGPSRRSVFEEFRIMEMLGAG